MFSSHFQVQQGTTRSLPHQHLLNPSWRCTRCSCCCHDRHHWKSEAVFGYALTIVGGLVALKYQCKGENPFEMHPVLMDVCVLSMLVSFSASTVAVVYPRIAPTAARILAHVSVLSGSLALVLLGSIVLHKKFNWAAYLLGGFPWAKLLIHSFKSLLKRVRQRTVEAVLITLSALGLRVPFNLINQQHQLPT